MAATDGGFDLYAEFLSPFLQEEALCNLFKGNDFLVLILAMKSRSFPKLY